MDNRELRFTQGVLIGSLSISILLASFRALATSFWMQVFSTLVTVLVALLVLTVRLHRRGKPTRWIISIAVIQLLVIPPELALRLVDFRYESGIQFGYPRPTQFQRFVPDERRFWRLDSKLENVNSLGFPGGEVSSPKPEDVYRILFLGDSVTHNGYPRYVQHFLNDIDRKTRYEAVNLGVAGYSSYQGAVIAADDGLRLEPDLAVVFFGWNDHWLAYGAIDAEKQVDVGESLAQSLVRRVYQKSRILQAFNAISASLSSRSGNQLEEVRVPEEHYRTNLHKIAETFHSADVPVAFVTAPTSHYSLGVPDYLVQDAFVPDKDFSLRIHRRYNDIVREVAEDTGAHLFDIEVPFALMRPRDLRAVFMNDGIHFTAVGRAVLSQRVASLLRQEVLD